MENKEYEKKGSLLDFYMENDKPVLILKDGFPWLSVTRIVTDDETTLDKFNEFCKLTDENQWLAWGKVLGTPDCMFKLAREGIGRKEKKQVMAAWWAKEHGLEDVYEELGIKITRQPQFDEKEFNRRLEYYGISSLSEKEKDLSWYALEGYLRTGYFEWEEVWDHKVFSYAVPTSASRTAPGELWILGDGIYNLLSDEKNPLVAGNAKCSTINLRYSRNIDPETLEVPNGDDGEDLRWDESSRIKGKYESESECDYDSFTEELKCKIDDIINNMPWDVTWSKGKGREWDKIRITYK